MIDWSKGAGAAGAGLCQEVGGAAGGGAEVGGGHLDTGAGQDAGQRHGSDAPLAPMVGGSEIEAPVEECVICFEGEKTHLVTPWTLHPGAPRPEPCTLSLGLW